MTGISADFVRADLKRVVADMLEAPQSQADRAIDAVFGAIKEWMLEQAQSLEPFKTVRVRVRGFGTFLLICDQDMRPRRSRRSLESGTAQPNPVTVRLKFNAGNEIQETLERRNRRLKALVPANILRGLQIRRIGDRVDKVLAQRARRNRPGLSLPLSASQSGTTTGEEE
jgi:nucleoid DNA-binding protein